MRAPDSQQRLLHVLCAEDQPIYADLVAVRFEDAGHKVKCVPDGQVAWETILENTFRFDLLVTDQQMPRLDGIALVRRLRDTGFPGRVIVHAAGLTADMVAQFERLKVDAIIPKGPESDHLLGTAEQLFRNTRNTALLPALTDQENIRAI